MSTTTTRTPRDAFAFSIARPIGLGVLFATLDFGAVTRARNAVPQLTHDRDFARPQ